MALSQKFAVAALAALLLGAVSASGQNQTPADMAALLAEVKGLRADVSQAAGASIRMQVLVSRVSLQEQRITFLGRQLTDVQDQLATATRERIDVEENFKRMSEAAETMRGQGTDAIHVEAQREIFKRLLANRMQTEQQLQLRATEMQNMLAQEQGRWSDFNNRLDELERSLPAR